MDSQKVSAARHGVLLTSALSFYKVRKLVNADWKE